MLHEPTGQCGDETCADGKQPLRAAADPVEVRCLPVGLPTTLIDHEVEVVATPGVERLRHDLVHSVDGQLNALRYQSRQIRGVDRLAAPELLQDAANISPRSRQPS